MLSTLVTRSRCGDPVDRRAGRRGSPPAVRSEGCGSRTSTSGRSRRRCCARRGSAGSWSWAAPSRRRSLVHLQTHGAVVFPEHTGRPGRRLPRAPLHRVASSTPGSTRPGGYAATVDARAYEWARDMRLAGDAYATLLKAIHDDSISDALDEWVRRSAGRRRHGRPRRAPRHRRVRGGGPDRARVAGRGRAPRRDRWRAGSDGGGQPRARSRRSGRRARGGAGAPTSGADLLCRTWRRGCGWRSRCSTCSELREAPPAGRVTQR